MLTKLENAYLFILRVVVLAAATLALLGVLLGLARSATFIGSYVTAKPASAEVPGGTLGDYVAEKHPQGVTLDSPSAAAPDETPATIKAAVRSLAHYARTRAGFSLNEDATTQVLVGYRAELPPEVQDQYGASIAALMSQLDSSKGNPLSADQISELLSWHFDKFKANFEAVAAQKQASQLQALQTLGVAGVGFGAFIALVFCFLVVKIERNLRLVHTVNASPSSTASA
jgi:hypothetical protein